MSDRRPLAGDADLGLFMVARTLRPRRVTYEGSRSVDEQHTWTFRMVRGFRWPERCAAAP